MSSSLFPQDSGTGVDSGNRDWNDAANFAQLAHSPNDTDYILTGYSLTPDFDDDTVDISQGVAYISAPAAQTVSHTDEGGPPAKTLNGVSYVAQRDGALSQPLSPGVVNYIYLVIDPAVSNSITFSVRDTESQPINPSLKIGEVDLANNTVRDSVNRFPDAQFNSLAADSIKVTSQPNSDSDAVRLSDLNAYGNTESSETVSGEWSFSGSLTLGAERTAVSGFNDSGTHWIEYDSDVNDDIFAIKRYGENDYDLVVSQAGALNRILTTADGAKYALNDHTHAGQTIKPSAIETDRVTISTTPTNSNEAATKSYVDTRVDSVSGGSGQTGTTVNVVNMIDEGADNTGATACDDLLDSVIDNNTRLIFPSGVYLFNQSHDWNDYDSLEIIGQPNATFKVGESLNNPFLGFNYGGSSPGRHTVLKNIDIDISGTDSQGRGVSCRPIYFHTREYGLVENVRTIGERSAQPYIDGDGGNISTHIFGVEDEDGKCVVRNFEANYGGEEVDNLSSDSVSQTGEFIGIASGGGINNGLCIYENCSLKGWINNAFYLKAHPGKVILNQCTAIDNGLTSIRLGEGHEANNCYIKIDADNVDYSSKPGCAAIWGEHGDVVVENCRIIRESGTNKLIQHSRTAGYKTVLRDCQIEDSGSGDIFDNVHHSGDLVFDNCDIYKDGGSGFTARVRDNNDATITLKHTRYETDYGNGNNQRGIYIDGIGATNIRECTFAVDDVSVANNNTMGWFTRNTIESGEMRWDGGNGAIRDNNVSAASLSISNTGSQFTQSGNIT